MGRPAIDSVGPWGPLCRAPFFERVLESVRADHGGACVSGLAGGSRALLLGLLAARTSRPIVLVVPDDAAVEAWQRDLHALAPWTGNDPRRITVLPALDADPYDAIAPHPEVVHERVVALGRIARREVGVLIAPVRAFLQWLPSPAEWTSWTRVVRPGDTLPPDRFVLQALALGYRRADTVAAPGEISRRGGIIDVFPPGASEPIRIELFADTVESLRAFDPDHQRSTGTVGEVVVGPAVEAPLTEAALQRLAVWLDAGAASAESGSVRPFRERLEQLQTAGYWPGSESLARLTAERPVSLFEHLADAALVVDESQRTDEELVRAANEVRVSWEQSADRTLPPPAELYIDAADVQRKLARANLFLQELQGEEPDSAREVHHVTSRPPRSYAGRIQDLAADLLRAASSGARAVCVMRAQGSADRLAEVLGEYGVAVRRAASTPAEVLDSDTTGEVLLGVGALRNGFEFPDLGLVVLAEREVFGEERPTADRKAPRRTAFISDFRDLKVSDLVVHVDHGIARYKGLGRPQGGSLNRDFMVLEYAAGDRLFVPVDRLDLVQKYRGAGGSRPLLDRLGGPGWERAKAKVRTSIQSMARELLDLYARRETAEGHAFSPDGAWQEELEAAFPHELTPDQERALAEVKSDMESPQPMDRLLVGDVGFGKTEIGVRAAFKAALDGHQVAVLAPTTVLAFQHFETFRERYAPFPVRVEMVSRLRTAAENRRVIEDVAVGNVDVLVGTHRLLSKDVQFKRLGLLLVDEEQRFGVAHKERLKKISVGVDVLSMTATPIPRTLQMSLAGVRDLSIIETPPPGRMAIQTYIVPFRKNVLGQAIRQELRRGGQVFVVHNRIDTLPALARAVGDMAPDARIVLAHGQMAERELEAVMLKFMHYEADVLITTTIIENGLDIPRANTIVINRADKFGLAQLYQLRGRVGRSHQHAYAYCVVPSRQQLSEDSRKRLLALQEFSELGAGFRLAAADLEIRGAGELLGARQHGHIATLGFDMYCRMLERAVSEMRGEPVVERRPPTLHLGVDIKVPESYLPSAVDRLALYKRLAQARDVAAIDRLRTETEDRFGHLPPAGHNLFDMGMLRLIAEEAGVKTVDLAEGRLQIRFFERPPIDPGRVIEMLASEHGSLTPTGMLLLPAPTQGSDRIESVRTLLERMMAPAA